MQKNHLNKKSITLFFPLFLAIYEMAIYLSNDAYLPALPYIGRDLKTTQHLIQLTLMTWFAGSASMQLFLGPIADRFGRKKILLIGGLFFIGSTLGCALTQAITILLTLRFIQGATITTMVVAGYATIHDIFSNDQAIHTLALMNSITILAPAFGPTFGAIVLQLVGSWRWIFGILLIWSAFALIMLTIFMPTTGGKHTASNQLRMGIIIQQYKHIVLNKRLMCTLLASRLLFTAMVTWITASPFLLINHYHLAPLYFSFVQLIIFSGFIVGGRFIKWLMKIKSNKYITQLGLITCLVSICAAILFGTLLDYPLWILVTTITIFSTGTSFVFPILERTAIEASTEPMGSRVAISSSLMGLGGVLGSLLVSLFYHGQPIQLVSIFLVLTATSLAIYLLSLTLKKDQRP